MQADDAVALEQVLVAAFGLRMVELTAEPWRAVAEPSAQPSASAVARLEAASSDVLTSLVHRRIRLDGPLALNLLRLCDGRAVDVRSLTSWPGSIRRSRQKGLATCFAGLTRTGVLEA